MFGFEKIHFFHPELHEISEKISREKHSLFQFFIVENAVLSRVKRFFVRILPEITAGPANAERSTSEEESILEKFGKVKHTTAWTERGALLPASTPTCKTPKPQILDFASRQENKDQHRKKIKGAAVPCSPTPA